MKFFYISQSFLLALVLVSFLTPACAPRFNTTPNPAPKIEIENNKIKSLYGTWNHRFEGKTFSFDLQLVIAEGTTQISTDCFAKDLQTSIKSVSRSNVEVGKLIFIDGITGAIQAGVLECGINFPADSYPASVKGDTLTILTASGPVDFSHSGPR
ncbi:MAG: hypothetical protein SGJ18_03695 [Pseudomonadota bacterium]|nr:hypothetical protein [Pseudomonadota bacterium]